MELDASVVWDFAGELVGTLTQRKGSTLATVTRIDPDGTTWVTTDGDGEAPAVGVSAGVAVGDTVALEWDGATMGIRANVSDPAPTGAVVRHAQRVASAAQKVAEAVNQHFFTDSSGIHVTEATQEDWEQSHMGPNVLINSLGQLFRDGLNNLLTLTTENGARALTIWDGAGNAAANVLAVFGEIVRIGRASAKNILIDADGISFFDALQKVVRISGEIDVAGRKIGHIEIGDGADGSLTEIAGEVEDEDHGSYTFNRRTVTMQAHAPNGTDIASIEAWAESTSDGSTDENGVMLYGEYLNLAYGTDYGSVLMTDAAKVLTAQRGSVGQTTSVPAGGYADVPVTFGRAYDSTPTVAVGLQSTSSAAAIGQISVAVTAVSATGFTARLFNAGTTDRSPGFTWIAMG